MCLVRKRGDMDDSETLDLSNWKDGVALNSRGEGFRRSKFCLNIISILGC